MLYPYPIKTAKKFSDFALKRIEEDSLSPAPENYWVWFVYYSKSLPNLVNVVDDLLKKNKKLSDSDCYELYKKFFGHNNQDNIVRNAGDQMQETIGGMNVAVSSAKQQAIKYSESLILVNEGLKGDKTKDEVSDLVNSVLFDTEEMISKSDHLQEMLNTSSNVIVNLRNDLEVARKEALTDALTGLANRKVFDQEMQRLISLSNGDEPYTFSMVFLDIDHFKVFNDKFGHQIGDRVLKLVAQTLNEGIKGRDTAIRYGGEEFVILLPETNIHSSAKVGDMLRKEVEHKELINRATGKKIAKITLSAGVSEYIKGETLEDFVSRVDSALYSSKETGRNKVTCL